jgi:selenide,water dikinase
MGPEDLMQVLRPLRSQGHPHLIVGLQTADDAAVWQVDSQRGLVQTVDFFTPIVDDPYTYGAIAAANSLSDVYAMGGEPFLALAIAAFPAALPKAILTRIFQGGADKAAEAGVVIAGGHTVTDDEPKYGLCVTGWVDLARVLTKAGAQAGDALYLTKPLGTGCVTTALKKGQAGHDHVDVAVGWMCRLNGAAARMLATLPVRACTDITGFGLLGHAYEMAIASGVRLAIEAATVPLLPGALDYARRGLLPGGADRNHDYLAAADETQLPRVELATTADEARVGLLFDPQTSGGLLFAAPAAHTRAVEAALRAADVPLWRIGEVTAGHGVVVRD